MSDKKTIIIIVAVMSVLFLAFYFIVEYVNNSFTIINPVHAGVCGLDVVDCFPEEEEVQYGDASWYDYTLDSGWSSVGHRVCASRHFKRDSLLEVTYLNNSTTCVVKDYGPDKNVWPERIIDLSSTAFADLAPLEVGAVPVIVKKIN